MGEDRNCDKCDYYRGPPNTLVKGKYVFICRRCKKGYDDKDERAERKMFEVS